MASNDIHSVMRLQRTSFNLLDSGVLLFIDSVVKTFQGHFASCGIHSKRRDLGWIRSLRQASCSKGKGEQLFGGEL